MEVVDPGDILESDWTQQRGNLVEGNISSSVRDVLLDDPKVPVKEP